MGVINVNMRELYKKIGGDYDDVLKRFGNENMIVRFVFKFLDDKSFEMLRDAVSGNKIEEAFRAAHTLKGICLNLGFGNLGTVSSEMTEKLRAGDAENGFAMYDTLCNEYKKTIEAISEAER